MASLVILQSLSHYLVLGPSNIFGFPYCENERLWRKLLTLTPERYQKTTDYQFDECNNAFIKPKRPVFLQDLLTQGLHKKASAAPTEEASDAPAEEASDATVVEASSDAPADEE